MYLLTGATGFLGREVLVRLLALGQPVLVTTRQRQNETLAAARTRIDEMIDKTAADVSREKLEVAFADVTEPDLGLSERGTAWIAQQPRVHVIHGAAEVRFDLPYEVMERQNLHGTQNVLALVRRLANEDRLARFDHVSTAYVAGNRDEVALESEIDVGQKNRNAYERTKMLAELEVKTAIDEGLPIAVHRPSIIVGDSRTGHASSFKVLYWPMKVYARGRWRTLFGRRDCTVDAVPVDYVADAMLHLIQTDESLKKTFHLCAGVEREATIEELVKMAQEVFDQKPVRYLDPDIYFRWIRPWLLPILRLLRPDVANKGGVFLPYLRHNPRFSTEQADRLLGPAGIRPPKVIDYFGIILRYAQRSDFGNREFELPAEVQSSSAR